MSHQLRTEKFSQMLGFLTDNYPKFEYVDFLCWLEIDDQIIRQMMPPKKLHNKAASGSGSMISSFIESEKTSELRNLLIDLERGSDAKPCLDQIQKYVYEAKTPFSRQGISRFLLGDRETKGFFCYAFSQPDECHFKCSQALQTMSCLISRATNPQADLFLNFLLGLSVQYISKYNFSEHVLASNTKRCKSASLDILQRYLIYNQQVKPSAILNPDALRVYDKWIGQKKKLSVLPAIPREVSFKEPENSEVEANCIFRDPKNICINTVASTRHLRLAAFRTLSLKGQLRPDGPGLLPLTGGFMRRLETVNHDILYLAMDAPTKANPKQETPSRGTIRWAHHSAGQQLIELEFCAGHKVFKVATHYSPQSPALKHRRVFRLSPFEKEPNRAEPHLEPVWTERKCSNNLTLSTNCEESAASNPRDHQTTNCVFEGDLVLNFSGEMRLERIELALIAMTLPTRELFTSGQLLDGSLFTLLGELLR